MGCGLCKLAPRLAGELVVTVGDGKESVTSADTSAPPPPPPPLLIFQPKMSVSGWPDWLADATGDALQGWTPRRADSFQKLDKIGQGTYSNVYKARDLVSGKVVALKKVRFDIMELESVKFMAREISVLRRLEHPNVVQLKGLVTSRVTHSMYLIFEYMDHDLAGLVASPGIKFTEPQVKCYMKQLLSGLEHCHSRGVLHRDIKGSNLLLDNEGILKIADFGLASNFDPERQRPMTSRVVTLWYRPPELLLGATYYGVGVDLWSAGCILAELLSGKPILPGRTEVEQLHKIFKLCGSPSEKYWKKSKLPHATMFKPQQAYKRCIAETYKDLSPSSLSLIETLLSLDPDERGTATAALNSEFFTTEPYACEPSSLPHYPPSKEMDAKLRDEKIRRQRKADDDRANGQGRRKAQVHDHRFTRAMPAPEANAELQVNLNRRVMVPRNISKSEKFPPPHQDGAVGIPTASFINPDTSFTSFLSEEKVDLQRNGLKGTERSKKTNKEEPEIAASGVSNRHLRQSSIGLLMEIKRSSLLQWKNKGKESQVSGVGK